ncbi:hypothetical protein KIW84_051124 [Lathyrus oleraceus]|uniref:Uncharacterized protein n=1 Tax=Pisum sativum TaxID=3888 RepID=A0A9D4WNC3_PEA|nr:hypothetical protein KIW84_051124 [Pisum sativum]
MSMAPFANLQCDPDWFRKPYPNQYRREQDEIKKFLFAYFNPTLLWMRLTTITIGLRVARYQLNLVAREFGLIQLLYKCLIPNAKTFLCIVDIATKRWLKGKIGYDPSKGEEKSMVRLPHVSDDGVCVVDAFLGPSKVVEDPCETSVRLKRLSPEGVTTFDKENTEDSDAPIQYRIMLRGHLFGQP